MPNKKLLITGLILVIIFVIIFLLVNFKISNSFDLTVFKLINEKWSVSFLDPFDEGYYINNYILIINKMFTFYKVLF